MNKEILMFHLIEARNQIDSIISKIEADKDDSYVDFSFSFDLTIILNYLFGSWGFRNMSMNEMENMSQNEYENIVFKLPEIDVRFNAGNNE